VSAYLPLFLAVSMPTLVAIVGIILQQSSLNGLRVEFRAEIGGLRGEIKEIAKELKDFRIEMAKEIGALATRIAVIETKLGLTPPPAKIEPAKEVAA